MIMIIKIMIIDKHKYSWYGIGFDRKGKFSVGNGFGKNCIIIVVDMSSSLHVNDKKKIFLFLLKVLYKYWMVQH